MKTILTISMSVLLLLGCSGDDDDAGGSGSSARAGSGGSTGGGESGSGDSGSGSGDSGSGSGDSGTGSGDSGTGSGDGGTGSDPTDVLALCGGPCACADGEDNDGDGVTDGFDLECTGPSDDDEGTFATGISGDNMDPKWQDCFFDGNSGAGDDGCRYHTDCLTGDKAADDPDCIVTQGCLDFCNPRTPNGCDCFGCCTIRQEDGSDISVVISVDCDEEHLEDCTTCTPSTQCGNECGECELCPGKEAEDLPDHCGNTPPPDGGTSGTGGTSGSGGTGGSDAGTPTHECGDGLIACNAQADCPNTSYYCSFGCCQQYGPD